MAAATVARHQVARPGHVDRLGRRDQRTEPVHVLLPDDVGVARSALQDPDAAVAG